MAWDPLNGDCAIVERSEGVTAGLINVNSCPAQALETAIAVSWPRPGARVARLMAAWLSGKIQMSLHLPMSWQNCGVYSASDSM